MQLTIEALDDQHLLRAEVADLARRHGDAERRDDARAQPLVLDGAAHVRLAVADEAERQFEDVRGRRGTSGPAPLAVVPQERGLLLRAGDGDPELGVVCRQRGRGDARELGGNRGVAERLRVDLARIGRRFVDRRDLDGADAIAPDGGQQVEGAARARVMPIL
ncbi:MAG TPA: hypothetical protein VMF52_10745 [Steroidobacteraceae bacterium]|nr:hypothetical protein [Steroidobacteraceae bacterium]